MTHSKQKNTIKITSKAFYIQKSAGLLRSILYAWRVNYFAQPVPSVPSSIETQEER